MDPGMMAPTAFQAPEIASGMEANGRFSNMDTEDAALAEMLTRELEGPGGANGWTSAENAVNAYGTTADPIAPAGPNGQMAAFSNAFDAPGMPTAGPVAPSDSNGQTTAFCPHNEPPHADHTCFHPYHSGYSDKYLPLILFRLDPAKQFNYAEVGHLIENGVVVMDNDDRPVRDFPFLPRYICTRPSGWLLEYWMRTDSRLTYRDVKARMTGSNLPTDNVLNMRREREARMPLGLSCWTARRGGITRTEVERVERLTPDQVAFNTTMDIEYVPGLNAPGKVPGFLRSKSLGEAHPQFFPLETFIHNRMELHVASPRLASAIELLLELQKTAMSAGYGCWRQLPANRLPASWTRRNRRAAVNADNDQDENDGMVALQSVFTVNSTEEVAGNGPNTGQSDSTRLGSLTFSEIASTNNTAIKEEGSSKDVIAVDANYTTSVAIAALSKIESGHDTTAGMQIGEDTESKKIPVDPRLINYTAVPTDSRTDDTENPKEDVANTGAGTANHQSEPRTDGLSRFNGTGLFSVRENGVHRLNANTPHIMDRNDPFENCQEGDVNVQRSFETYVMEDVPNGQNTH